MGKTSKASKKFVRKHLGAAIKQRKTRQNMKRAKQHQEGPKGTKAPPHAAQTKDAGISEEASGRVPLDMSIDEFLDGGFEDVAAAGGSSGDGEGLVHSEDGFGTSDSDEERSVSEPAAAAPHAAVGSKRKRFAAAAKHADTVDTSEDEEQANDALGGSKAVLQAETAAHKAQLQALKEQDPEFFAYLQSTDQELLNFGRESEDELDSDDDLEDAADVEEDGQAGQPAAGASHPGHGGVTLAMIESWCEAAEQKGSLGAVRNLLKAYRQACHYGDTEEQVEETMRIASSAVYNKLMLFVLRKIDGIFRSVLLEGAGSKQEPLSGGKLVKLPRWKKVDPMVKSYLGNTLHLLGVLTDGAMLAFILRRLRVSTVFLAPYEKLQRRLLKASLGLFGSADSAPRVQAILLVRQMALDLPQPALDNCLKGVYRAFSSNAKFVNAASMPQINFMAAAVVEMYSINAAASYQHAFSFIRQLAVLLRSALTGKSKDSFREVYCWQTINCLELWSKLLAARAEEQQLRPLIYPVTQLLLGVARLLPAPEYFPLRLRCARALNRLGAATNTFIPVAPVLLEVLQWNALHKAPQPGSGQQSEVLLQLRVSKASMRTMQFQEEVVNQVMELLADHLATWGCHVAFPELSFLTVNQLRKFAKHSPVERFRKAAKQLVDAIEKNVAFVGRARDQVDFSPKDLGKVATFLAMERAAQKAPVQKFARELQDRARQRLQLQTTAAMDLTNAGSNADDDSYEPEALLPSKQRSSAKQAKARPADDAGQQQQRQQQHDVEVADQEELTPFHLSDEDEDEIHVASRRAQPSSKRPARSSKNRVRSSK